ncbi:MAG: asparagine synthetase A [Thermoplasmata archaeon]
MALRTIEEIVARKRMGEVMEVQTEVIHTLTESFKERGFKWMLPVMLSFVTDPLWPEPSSTQMTAPEVEIYGKKMKLMHSMILHKQIAVSMGLDKIFVLSPNIRIERPERDDGHHAYEFTQLDFEIVNAKMGDVMALVEEFVSKTADAVRETVWERFGREIPVFQRPFKVYTMEEVVKDYGSDRELSRLSTQPFWIIDISREFYDKEDEARPGHYLNYDLIMPEGYGEVLSGGEREHEYEKIIAKLERAKLSPSNFWPYLEIARKGLLKPSAGAGIGIERLVRYFTGLPHIEEVQVFPRIPGVPAVV